MKHRRIKIDWDSLEEAFNRPPEDVASYLDRVTGRVVLEGEGEADPLDDDDGSMDGPASERLTPLRDDAVRLYVHPPDAELKIEWLKAFLDGNRVGDEQARQLLLAALDADDPVEELGEVLGRHPDVRDTWYAYRTERLHEMIDAWLETNGIASIDPPPWRS
jgi:hypothetical protein